MIIINFKNYVYGKKALDLAKKIRKYIPRSIVCPASTDISIISKGTKLQVFAQHVSGFEKGRATGYITPSAVKSAGAKGTLLNHSEHKIKLDEIKKTIKECKKVNLKLIVCVSNMKEASLIKNLKPYAISFEDPKLVSTGKSITEYRANDLKKFVSLLKNTKILALCGAGISSKKDYVGALKIGCKGVLISSAVANSRNPERFLKEIVDYK
jgi:triosephosphate isomerase|tara:strand:- start:229 stop:861 length:633 start_codon:yes stop_codon:yes gene_type:complete